MKARHFLPVAIGMAVAAPNATAQVYPSRPITMTVPFAPGGPTDTIARMMAEPMRAALGQPVIVENVVGAAGSIGVGRVARAAPDGYTLSTGNWSTHVVNGAIYALPYDLLNDLEPVALLATNPQLIVTKNSVPARDLKQLIGWLKQNAGKATAGTAGAGSASHVGGIFFQSLTGTRFQFAPYRGTAPAMQDLAAGHIDSMFDQAINSLPQVRARNISAFAVTSKSRHVLLPDVPTVDEAGLPGFYISVWHGLWASKGTPKEIIAKLNAAVVEALAEPKVRHRLADLAQDIPPREDQTPSALHTFQKAETEKWWPLIKAANIKGE
jgi:tripartite-type tricarboxylate transporter receptor subunit TctC